MLIILVVQCAALHRAALRTGSVRSPGNIISKSTKQIHNYETIKNQAILWWLK